MNDNKEKTNIDNSYMDRLKERGEGGRVTKSYQMTGLQLANILDDQKHKGLYMRLAKKYNNNDLMILAKDVADRPNISNRGAYFMKVFKENKNKLRENK